MTRLGWMMAVAGAISCGTLTGGVHATQADEPGSNLSSPTLPLVPNTTAELPASQPADGEAPTLLKASATPQPGMPADATAAHSGNQQPAEPGVAGRVLGPFLEPNPLLSPPTPPVTTLQQALARTYQTNPTLMARRAELRGLDSAVALERAAGNPQLITGATLGQELYITRPLGTRGRNLSANAELSQIVFAGGRIRNSVKAARTRVLAGRADLRATEGDLLTEAVAAYADVLRDRDIRDLNLSQVRILQANLESTRSRFAVRDLTLTDVAQSEARLDVVQSNLATAEGRLQASEENFERVVGARAGALESLPPLPPLPLSSDQAVDATLANNADIAALAARARAADYDVAATKSARLPTLSLVSTADYDDALGTADSSSGVPPGTMPNSATNVGAALSLRLPLYQGGAVSARVRQAEEFRAQQVEEAIAVERLAVADARTAFSIWRSALKAIAFNESAVVANEKALESVKVEQTVGARSILDVLNAEQELLSSKIALTSARREAYVAAFDLLNTMGASEAADLNLDAGPLYDPHANYRRYADAWSDWADGPRRPQASTRNVSAEVESPVTRLTNGTLNASDLDD